MEQRTLEPGDPRPWTVTYRGHEAYGTAVVMTLEVKATSVQEALAQAERLIPQDDPGLEWFIITGVILRLDIPEEFVMRMEQFK